MTSSFSSKLPRAAKLLALGALAAVSSTACLERPVGREQPKTTNVIVDTLVQSSVDKIDLLFMIDNSISMADKQEILALALPDLVGRLVSPVCVDRQGQVVNHPESATEQCPQGSGREFNPIDDIHIGVITSSLGGYGAQLNCAGVGEINAEQAVDMAVLLGSLPRGATAAPSASATGFLSWTPQSSRGAFSDEFASLVRVAGEFGCGWEATLESWYRFLVDPNPYTKIVRLPCNSSDTGNSCAGPERDPQNPDVMLTNTMILSQRQQFLRPDSLLAIVMLSDENDCSFKASGQMWRLSQTQRVDANNAAVPEPAFKGTAACSDPAFGPNHECCHSCGQRDVAAGCPTAVNASNETVALGCEADGGRKYLAQDPLDHPNLRCFQQKVRFGVDYLYPVERYTTALKSLQICPFADTLAPDECADPVDNPLYADLQYQQRLAEDPDATPALPRNPNLIFLAGIVGVPWQDVAISANDPVLRYRVARGDADDAERIDWNLIIGPRDTTTTGGIPAPADPLMRESVEPRSGTHPITNEPLAQPGSGYMANSINGHEWNISDRSDLQYACIFPLLEEKSCPSIEEADQMREAGMAVSNCDCTDYPGDTFGNPLCQAENDGFDNVQRYAKAYPSLRELQVLHDYGDNSIVASICPKSANPADEDFGYRPAVAAIVDRLKEQLADKCLTRALSVREGANGQDETACIIIEAKRGVGSCDEGRARLPVRSEEIATVARRELQDSKQCRDAAECADFQLCEIEQLTPGTDPGGYESCLNDEQATGDGWCYVDPSRGLGSETLVEKCPETAKRKLRFVGSGTPESGTVTLVACSGEAFNED